MTTLINVWFSLYRAFRNWLTEIKACMGTGKYMVLSQLITTDDGKISSIYVSFFDDFNEANHKLNYLSLEYQKALQKMEGIDEVSVDIEEDEDTLVHFITTDSELLLAISVNKIEES